LLSTIEAARSEISRGPGGPLPGGGAFFLKFAICWPTFAPGPADPAPGGVRRGWRGPPIRGSVAGGRRPDRGAGGRFCFRMTKQPHHKICTPSPAASPSYLRAGRGRPGPPDGRGRSRKTSSIPGRRCGRSEPAAGRRVGGGAEPQEEGEGRRGRGGRVGIGGEGERRREG
jgi:hypothetical protein